MKRLRRQLRERYVLICQNRWYLVDVYQSGDSWVIDGPSEILVSKFSATHSREWEQGDDHLCAIDATHSDIVKFDKNQTQKRIVLNILRDLGRRALNLKDHLQDPTVKCM